jgi:hypothetical protein
MKGNRKLSVTRANDRHVDGRGVPQRWRIGRRNSIAAPVVDCARGISNSIRALELA